jgi:LuxR family maltose regulon positive regulatory protein
LVTVTSTALSRQRRATACDRSGDLALPLVEAKLAPPTVRMDVVERSRLTKALEDAAHARLILVAAPPGYGKTTAVRAWCADRGAALAWITADAGDNDPTRLWRYVATAVDRVRQGLGRNALHRLDVSGAPIEAVIDELANGLAAFGRELVVVIDDFQSVTDVECLATVDYALEHLPPTAHLVVVSRIDPGLRLAQLRARGALAEVRQDELAFTEREAHELVVARGGLELEAEEVETLCRRTAGWPAALFLATLWLRHVEDPRTAVREFGGSHRFVADYLSEEVLARLDPELRSFLLQASVLGRFTAPLCDAVLDRADSASMLAELVRRNLFVAPLERGGWFSVHALFAEFARLQLASVDPAAEGEIHRRAARWLRSHNLPIEAVGQADAAGQLELIAEILAESHLALIRTGGARTVLRWAGSLSDEQLVDRPEVAVAAATSALITDRKEIELRRLLALVDRARRERPDRLTPYVEACADAVCAWSLGRDVGEAVEAGRRAVEIAAEEADDVLVAALAGYARALYFAAEPDLAWAVAVDAIEHPDAGRRPPSHAVARATMALAAVDRGRLEPARLHAEKAKSVVGAAGSSRSWLGANAAAALGAVLLAEGRLADSERELSYAERFFRDEIETVQHVWTLTMLARIRCRRGRLQEAGTALASARSATTGLTDPGRVEALLAEVGDEFERTRKRAGRGGVLEQPSPAELAVLRLLPTDLSMRQIGAELFLSPNTVHTHTRAIYRKLGVASRAEAVARATTRGLLDESRSPG